ncbi:MAG: hypothetical protein UY77_C0025G0007 [Candidatus Uhrbacteria bacterium GW2011_GWA2_53_10]|uniref:Uncharacterized protein n=1 Tax=Candidatus Uhrbacteria bacterium GW2011_GWA2_53_10 TaxID=1618980 RepID=A0A0G1XN61_9BACT|nr:MAG: hypothetical protein UY77_C0025G0007 [Candidatus Uhrbacteria bacterium GW2011_GWA2_53_10]
MSVNRVPDALVRQSFELGIKEKPGLIGQKVAHDRHLDVVTKRMASITPDRQQEAVAQALIKAGREGLARKYFTND